MPISGGGSLSCVAYSYYNATFADVTSYTVTVTGLVAFKFGGGTSDQKILISGNGAAWSTGASGVGVPETVVGVANKLRCRNESGAACVAHVSGWYYA